MAQGLRAGELAARSGIGRKAMRLYEARGILAPPSRTAAGYRIYPPETLALLAFVSRARRLGLTLAEIAQIVALRRAGTPPCAHIRALLEQRATDLAALLRELRGVLKSWDATSGRLAAVCPHIEGKGGKVQWKGVPSLSAPRVQPVRKSSSMATRFGSAKTPIRPFSRRRSGTSLLT